jgi:hypothetical protein
MRIKNLILKSIKSKTLLTDIFGYGLVVTNFADKYLAGQLTMYKEYNWLKRKFGREVRDYSKIKVESERGKDYVWLCWLQGIDNAPQLVKDCYSSVRYWLKDKEIIVITKDNYKDYVQFPEYVIEKWNKGIISNTHFSDLLRLELLIKYGGFWLDATTYLTGKVPSYVEKNDFFVYRNGWMDMEMINMGSWFIYSKRTNNLLLVETRRLLYKYWRKYNYIKNYFLMHMFFRMVTDKNQGEWEKVPVINQIDSHLLMQELNNEYDFERYREITKLTSIHKLTYKGILDEENTVLKCLDELYKRQEKI